MRYAYRMFIVVMAVWIITLGTGQAEQGDRDQASAAPPASESRYQAPAFEAQALEQKPRGVYQFRDGAMRRNGTEGYPIEDPIDSLSLLWSQQTIAEGSAKPLPAPNQPLIVKWFQEFREATEQLFPEKREQVALKEVMYVGADGRLHFWDLEDGEPTRAPWASEGVFTSMPTVHESGMPFLFIGEERDGRNGLRVYHTLNGKTVTLLSHGMEGSYISLPPLTMIDNQTRLLCVDEGNLWAAWATVDISWEGIVGTPDFRFDTTLYENDIRQPEARRRYPVQSFAALDAFIYLADTGGMLQCMDLNKLTPVWNTRLTSADAKQVRLALEPLESGEKAVYSITASRTFGDIYTMQRTDGDTGMAYWTVFDDWADVWLKTLPSPLVGEGDIYDAVVFGWNTRDGGQLSALDKETGEALWEQSFDAALTSSPIAVYQPDGTSFILQGDESGKLWLLQGFDGMEIDFVQLSAAVLDAPAAYSEYVVVPTADGALHCLTLGEKN